MRATGGVGALGVALVAVWALTAQAAGEPETAAPAAEVPAEAAVEEAGPLTLEDAMALALEKSPALAEFSAAVRAGDAHTLQAKKLPNPQLDVRGYRIETTGNDTEEGRLRAVLSQPIELGGKRGSRVDLARVERDVAGWDYAITRGEVLAEVAGQFAAVLGAQRRVESAGRFLEFVERVSGQVEGLVASGALRTLEVHLVARERGLARIEHQRAQADLGTARFKLAATWGSRAPQFTEAVGELAAPEPVPDLETVLQLAARSPAVARGASEVARREAELGVAKASRIPDMRLGAGMRWEEDTSEHDYLFDFEIALPIFDRKQGDIQEAQHLLDGAWSARRAAEAEAAELAAELHHALAEARVRAMVLGDEIVPAANAAFEAHRIGFERGAADLDDLLDERRALARAESDHAQALVDYSQLRATLESLLTP